MFKIIEIGKIIKYIYIYIEILVVILVNLNMPRGPV